VGRRQDQGGRGRVRRVRAVVGGKGGEHRKQDANTDLVYSLRLVVALEGEKLGCSKRGSTKEDIGTGSICLRKKRESEVSRFPTGGLVRLVLPCGDGEK